MLEELHTFERIREVASHENDRLARKHRISGADAPLYGLNVIHQHATLSAELVGFYIGWAQDPANRPPAHAQRHVEDSQRLITLGKSALILSLSAIEAAAKGAIVAYPSALPTGERRRHLSGIVGASAGAGIITTEFKRGWEAVIELRNALVHTNAVPERNLTWPLPGGPTIALKRGKMLAGSTRMLPELVHWVARAFAAWSDEFLVRARAA